MAFLRFSRDNRGYEHFYLVQPTTNRRGKVRSRVLYWFRSPPNVKVGRQPFDDAVRRALEAQNPDVQFDWPTIIDTPIPTADTERWRERRRAERAARQAAAEDEQAEPRTVGDPEVVEESGFGVSGSGFAGPESRSPNPVRRRRRRGRRGRPITQPGADQSAASSAPQPQADTFKPSGPEEE